MTYDEYEPEMGQAYPLGMIDYYEYYSTEAWLIDVKGRVFAYRFFDRLVGETIEEALNNVLSPVDWKKE